MFNASRCGVLVATGGVGASGLPEDLESARGLCRAYDAAAASGDHDDGQARGEQIEADDEPKRPERGRAVSVSAVVMPVPSWIYVVIVYFF